MTIQHLISVLSNCKTFNKVLVLSNGTNEFSVNRFILLPNGKFHFQIQWSCDTLESGIDEREMSCLIENYQIKDMCAYKNLDKYLECASF